MKERNKKEDRKQDPKESKEVCEDLAEALDTEPRLEKEKKEIEELKKRLEEKEKEAKENHDRLLRSAADFENYKKRAAKEKEEWIKFANEDVIKAVLPFIDNLERAVNHSEKTEDFKSLVEGIRLTIQQLLKTLNKFGVSRIESLGKRFDPAVHEAMLLVETDQHQPNHVVQEFQKGYLLNDRLLRPATVSVSKPPEKDEKPE